MGFTVNSEESVSRVMAVNPEDGVATPMNLLVVASSGAGKTLCAEQIVHFFWRHGWTIISLSDVKDSYEFGFSMFEPEARYHLRKLNKFGCPVGAIPTKLYHPFTFNLPKNAKLPPIDFYTVNIKDLTRVDMNFLAESLENKRSIQILLEQSQKLARDDGLHHLIFNAENQTESIANLTKSGIKYRSDNPDDFFTRSKIGTEKTSGEMNAYFKPFLTDYALAPAICPHNLNVAQLINDQGHYHIFSTRWVKDKRLKAFFVLHLLQEILNHEGDAKHPILLYVEEIRFLVPNNREGFANFLAGELKDTMTRFRNMGKGFGIISTTQVYRDVHPEVIDTFNEVILGRIASFKEIDFISKALKLTTQDTNLIKSLDVGDFVIKTKDEFSDEPSLQKVRFFMPPHAHKEGGYSFFDWYAKKKKESMTTCNDLLAEMQGIKNRVIEEVEVLKDKENITKREAIRQEREAKLTKEKERIKAQMQKLQKGAEKKEQVDEKLKELIHKEWQTATGRDKSTRSLAKKFNLFMSSGEPNHKAVQRAIAYMERKIAAAALDGTPPETAPKREEENKNEVDETMQNDEQQEESTENEVDETTPEPTPEQENENESGVKETDTKPEPEADDEPVVNETPESEETRTDDDTETYVDETDEPENLLDEEDDGTNDR